MLIRDRFSSDEIAAAIGVSKVQGNNIVRHFLDKDLIKIVWGTGAAWNPRLMRIVLNTGYKWGSGGGVNYLPKKNGQQMLWNSIKILRTFTIDALTYPVDVAPTSAQQYIKSLRESGYLKLRLIGKRQKGILNGFNVYVLIRDTGRLAPKMMKNGCWDQNTQQLYPYTFGVDHVG